VSRFSSVQTATDTLKILSHFGLKCLDELRLTNCQRDKLNGRLTGSLADELQLSQRVFAIS